MKFSFVKCALGISACVMTSSARWSVVAVEMQELFFLRDLSLLDQDTPQQEIDDTTCDKVCEDEDQLVSIQLQVVQVQSENNGLFGSIIHRFNDFFDNDTKFGSLMNGFLNLLRRRHSNKPRYEIFTDAILPVLTDYSMKAKSLAALIRNESTTYAAASDTPDVVKTLFDLSAENMESVASVIDPILDEMRQQETMDLVTFSCSIEQLLTHVRDETLPNIVSIAEFVYTKSGNVDMEKMYDNYVSASTLSSDGLAKAISRIEDSTVLNQCRAQGSIYTLFPTEITMESSSTSVQSRLDTIGVSLGPTLSGLITIVGLIIIYPLSFLVSLVTIVFVIFKIILAVIFKKPILPIPEDDDQNVSNDDDINSVLEVLVPIVITLGLIASPILIPIFIIFEIIDIFAALLNPMSDPIAASLSNQRPTTMSNDVMRKVLVVLESSMENMVESLNSMYSNEDTEDTDPTMDCGIRTISCKNDALTAALPF